MDVQSNNGKHTLDKISGDNAKLPPDIRVMVCPPASPPYSHKAVAAYSPTVGIIFISSLLTVPTSTTAPVNI